MVRKNMKLIEFIKLALSARQRQLHGEFCAECHGSGSNRTCKTSFRTEYNPGPSDSEILDVIEEIFFTPEIIENTEKIEEIYKQLKI